MEKECSGQRPVEANSTGGQGSRKAVAPSDDDDDERVQSKRAGLCNSLYRFTYFR